MAHLIFITRCTKYINYDATKIHSNFKEGVTGALKITNKVLNLKFMCTNMHNI